MRKDWSAVFIYLLPVFSLDGGVQWGIFSQTYGYENEMSWCFFPDIDILFRDRACEQHVMKKHWIIGAGMTLTWG
ncbi:hypothetical protein F5884DRAFT_798095 [Xylogone sp. PMI_703]|nr:hypothetical protein F5884DRAFT_798095 [Xylogone sp. PMI_703]